MRTTVSGWLAMFCWSVGCGSSAASGPEAAEPSDVIELPRPAPPGPAPPPAPAPLPAPGGVIDSPIVEGVGIGPLQVGTSTLSDLEAWLGPAPDETVHGDYSIEKRYPKVGISAYFCQSDPAKRLFVIELRPPFRGQTPEKLVPGKSTLGEVIAARGSGEWLSSGETWWMGYHGVSFHVDAREGSATVEEYERATVVEIDVELTADGSIAQCGAW